MAYIRILATGETVQVAQAPQYRDGTWECGDQRFTDPAGDQYMPVQPDITISPVEFKLLWLPMERLAIKSMRLTDPVVGDFYELLEDPRLTVVNLSLASTQQAVDYLLSKLVDAEVLAKDQVPERRAAILSGQFT